ncbi:1-acyl-sn-glycerol-3-phosphate acyltransferase [Polystyrenella longa]|uniref:1-acyl-sn-glycerol-3-phosphate acyltransferase n=1 Tax=Polystyrenella longa TaxID=2528007 RepID=A0A518CJ55_9PLAN|nr:lysophospholipid acyltransferase family protein [Polystyrenella longa]QDU79266.1 1-acyl-sn-glycerol-3-phosphate acyltransferase [Polystyrenella longa]
MFQAGFFDQIRATIESQPYFGLYLLLAYLVLIFGWLATKVLKSDHTISGWALFLMVHLYVPMVWRVRINKRCPYPADGPGLIIANHRSPVDPFLVCVWNHLGVYPRTFRLVSFLMAQEYYTIPVVSWVSRTMECVPIARSGRDMQGVKDCLSLLKKGHLVGVFPEGRLNTGDGVMPFGTGIAWLALRAKVPIYPVYIHDTPVSSSSMVEPFIKRTRSRLVYGDPIDLSPFYADSKKKETIEEVTELLHTRLAELEYPRPEPSLPF